MKKLILFLILIPSLCFAETIGISQESQKDLTIAQQNLQIISCNVIQKEWLPELLKKTGCTIQQDKLICPDPPKEEVKKDAKKPD